MMPTFARRHVPSALVLAALAGLSACATPRESGPAPATAPEAAAPAGGIDLVERAKSLDQAGDATGALAELERAIAENPRLTVAYLAAGDIHRRAGDYARAESQYAKAAEIEPGNFDAQYLHGLVLQVMNRLSDAVRAYLRALQIRPDDFDANLNLATAYLQLGEPSQGLPFAQKALELRPADGAARANLGSIYAALGRYDEAVVEYQQAAELTELSPPLLLNLADALGRVGRHAEMAATLEQVIALQPSAVAWERYGSAHFRLRRYDEALRGFRKSLEIDANHYPALNGIGVCLLNQYLWGGGKDITLRDEALRVLRRSLQIERRQPRIVELITRYS